MFGLTEKEIQKPGSGTSHMIDSFPQLEEKPVVLRIKLQQ